MKNKVSFQDPENLTEATWLEYDEVPYPGNPLWSIFPVGSTFYIG